MPRFGDTRPAHVGYRPAGSQFCSPRVSDSETMFAAVLQRNTSLIRVPILHRAHLTPPPVGCMKPVPSAPQDAGGTASSTPTCVACISPRANRPAPAVDMRCTTSYCPPAPLVSSSQSSRALRCSSSLRPSLLVLFLFLLYTLLRTARNAVSLPLGPADADTDLSKHAAHPPRTLTPFLSPLPHRHTFSRASSRATARALILADAGSAKDAIRER
ncbi:hypothetical protein K438DRAFT_1962377 [Mycena galopus ATCC 62051]|nr:hypothetical protein K438DRAFT_1962377 [Mycena galopus ATCC 62051]